ncbi:MAG: bacillithiol system redox-active protein YtxJ [Flavobacterium sp.]|nr:MAG: bacillithiol system redox-active protein YtxJ [Flavobacterium sp.]
MSLFNKIFGDSDNKDKQEMHIRWKSLTEVKQLEQLLTDSFEKPVFIFKHSTRCSISRMALRQFETHYHLGPEEADGYYLDLLEHRMVSDAVAARLEITHQSPQLILIRDGKCVFTESHGEIDAEDLEKRIHHKPA